MRASSLYPVLAAAALAAFVPFGPAAARSTVANSVSIQLRISGLSPVNTTVTAAFVSKDTGCFAGYDKSHGANAYALVYHATSAGGSTGSAAGSISVIVEIEPYRTAVSSYTSSKQILLAVTAGGFTYLDATTVHAPTTMSLRLGAGGRSGSLTATHVTGSNDKTNKTAYGDVALQWTCSGIAKP